MLIVDKTITLHSLHQMADEMFGDMVKAVVDVRKRLLALHAELHADLESLLLSKSSSQDSLWGINLYPHEEGDDFVEFDSMINLRPSQGNMSRGIDDENIRRLVLEIVNERVVR